ncbi:MAG: acyl-CoA reductase [Acholeplasmataceae bacterium]|jgi:hypothetical protein|nr:acyl-CoA reductase [Acholeplasmataceae bacterium]
MILYQGQILGNEHQSACLNTLKKDCYQTLNQTEQIQAMDVIMACDQLAQRVKSGAYNELIIPLLEEFDIPYDYFLSSIPMFEKEALIKKCEIELGSHFDQPSDLNEDNMKTIYPLGILFHIAAGNVDVLPAYSVIEGLLAGNINLLKLPSGDRGVSVKLLSELIAIEPKLKDYIYVFDVPSTEIESLKILADIADGIVVWGGDVAVAAARKMASITTKIIAWGHKLSFAYATLDAKDDELEALAHHISMTNQVLCSSAQGIFVDTDDRKVLDQFADRFFQILKSVNQKHKPVPLGIRGKNNLQLYYEELNSQHTKKRIWKEEGISVITSDDHELELSMLFRSVWIKGLPRKQIIEVLKPHKNHLQTVGLMCADKDLKELTKTLALSGVVRITQPGEMSRMLIGESHDGTYALREYTRIVESIK